MSYLIFLCTFRYFIVHFDSPNTVLAPLHDMVKRDLDIIKAPVFRKEILKRPCEEHPCDFGELDDDMRIRNKRWEHEYIKKLW